MIDGFKKAEREPVRLELPKVVIPRGDVLKRLGYPSASVDLQEPIRSLFEDALREAASLMRLRAAYRVLPIETNDGNSVRFQNAEFTIESRQVSKLLIRSRSAVCFAVTAGPELDEAISGRMRTDDMLTAALLDAAGSETADAAADELHWKILSLQAEASGLSVTPRFSPGYGDWALTVQKDLIRECGGALIGITVTQSFLMLPTKSISAVFGLQTG